MRTVTACLVALPAAAFAQSGEIPKSVLDGLSKDLASLQRAVIEAQEKQQRQVAGQAGKFKIEVTETALVHLGAGEKAETLTKASKGKTYDVLSQTNGWYAVKLDESVKGKSSGWIQASQVVPVSEGYMRPVGTILVGNTAPATGAGEDIFSTLTDQAARFKQAYQNNKYVTVTGFSVSVVPPSISLNFEFKK